MEVRKRGLAESKEIDFHDKKWGIREQSSSNPGPQKSQKGIQPSMIGEKRTFHDRGGDPALSVIMVSPRGFDGVLPAIFYIADQTIAERIELLVSTPNLESFQPAGSSFRHLHSLHAVDAGDFGTNGEAIAPAILNARSPVVALTENHAFPAPEWAERLLDAHHGPWIGVTPCIEVFNPRTAWSRIASFMNYGLWIGVTDSTELQILPWHNSSYKREPLVAFGEELPTLLDPESRLQDRLRAQGGRFYIEAGARTSHVETSAARTAILAAFHLGRQFAVTRQGNWSIARRLLYAVSWPLFPWIRLAKMRGRFQAFRNRFAILPLMPGIFVLLFATAFGECLGYLAGMGDGSRSYLLKLELEFPYRLNEREQLAIERDVEERLEKEGR